MLQAGALLSLGALAMAFDVARAVGGGAIGPDGYREPAALGAA